MIELYTEGRCYDFFLILRSIYQDAEAWYDGDHVFTKINGRFYDIRGVYLGSTERLYKLDHSVGHKPHRWSKSDRRRLK